MTEHPAQHMLHRLVERYLGLKSFVGTSNLAVPGKTACRAQSRRFARRANQVTQTGFPHPPCVLMSGQDEYCSLKPAQKRETIFCLSNQ